MTSQTVTEGTLRTSEGRALPLKGTEVRATLSGPLSDVEVEQRFVNDTGEAIEAVYAFPLPPGASVYRMSFTIADRVVRAVVKEKEEARRDYEAARASGRAATLLEEDEPSLFTLSVANVPPGATVKVELAYQELLGFDDGQWRFVFPMVAPERYVEMPEERVAALRASSEQGSAGATLPKSAVRPPRLATGERAPDVSLSVRVRASSPIEALRCPSHPIEIEGGQRDKRVTLRAGEVIANRDFVLTFRAGGAGVRPTVRFERAPDREGTFLLCFTPPSDAALPVSEARGGPGELKAIRCGNCGGLVTDLSAIKEIPGLGPAVPCGYCGAVLAPSTERPFTRATRPRDVLVLVDRSASMRSSLPQARRAVRALLESLPSGDAVQAMAFDHERAAFDGSGKGFVTIAPEVTRQIDDFLGGLAPRGGTELDEALERASELRERDGRTSVVVLVTDAAVGNEGRVVRRAKELLGSRRLFVLGVGPAVDRRLCERLARSCGGASDVLGAREDVEPVIARFARRVREAGPVLTGLSLSASSAAVRDVYPRPLPDLFSGEPVSVLGRFDASGPCTWALTGTTADGRPFRQELTVELPEASDEAPGLARMWAKRRIDALLESLEDGREKEAEVKAEITRLALESSLASKYTSLVAIDSEVSTKGAPRRVEQPSSRAEASAELALDGGARGGAASPGAPMPASLMADVTLEEGALDVPRGSAPAARPAARTRTAAGAPPMASMAAPPPPPRAPASAKGVLGKLKRAILGDEEAEMLESAVPRTADRDYAPAPQARPSIEAPGSEPYPERELAWLRERASGELDLVFLVDETGSMGPYIEEVKARLLELVTALRAMPLCKSLRLGVVTYRDHPPQDHTYASRVVALTDDIAAIEAEVRELTASGGGDGPESVTDGLFDVVRLRWRPSAAKAVVWFGDAPPHGVEPGGDGFPQGCPCGNHWYTQAESCREMGVAIYAVGCLPNLRHYAGAEEVFRTVATTSRGIYLPLTSAGLLVPLMASAAANELDRRRVDAHVLELVRAHEALLRELDETERVRWLGDVLRHGGVRAREMKYDESSPALAPLCFRDVEPRDVEGALGRLRSAGTIAL